MGRVVEGDQSGDSSFLQPTGYRTCACESQQLQRLLQVCRGQYCRGCVTTVRGDRRQKEQKGSQERIVPGHELRSTHPLSVPSLPAEETRGAFDLRIPSFLRILNDLLRARSIRCSSVEPIGSRPPWLFQNHQRVRDFLSLKLIQGSATHPFPFSREAAP